METRSGSSQPAGKAPFFSRQIRLRQYPIQDAGVDWITCTCKEGETQSRFNLMGHSMLHVEAEAGAKLVPWNFESFEGLNAGEVAFGVRDNLSILRLSSSAAWANWRRAFDLATNCSRLDLQVTFRNVPDVDCLIRQSHHEALSYSESTKLRPQVEMRDNNRRGPTLYLGVRTSNRFGRLYNKFRESKIKHYESCARAELQLNGKAAVFGARALSAMGREPHLVVPYVSGFFQSRGVSPWWPYSTHRDFAVPRRRSSAARRLRWLRIQVAPAVKLLAEQGYSRAAFEALGLDELVRDSSWSNGPTFEEME